MSKSNKKGTKGVSNSKKLNVSEKPVLKEKLAEPSEITKPTITFKKVDINEFVQKNKGVLINVLWVFVAVLGLFLVDLFVRYINNDYSAAVVNNKRISVNSLKEQLLERSGKQLLSDMIREELILQAGEEAGIKVTDEEVEKEYKKKADLYGGEATLKLALEANRFTKESYMSSLKIQITAQKTLVPEPTEKELKAFFEKTKETYFASQEKYEDNKDNVKQIYVQSEFETKFSTWFQKLIDDANVQNNLEKEPKYGFFKATRNIFTNVYDSITSKDDKKSK